MRPDRRLCLNAASHLLVDGLCAATVFGKLADAADLPMLILLYNTLAFSTQCLVGLAADRLKSDQIAASVSMLCIVLGYALPIPGWLRVGLIGLGNSVFHVAGGRMTLLQSDGKAWPLGVFVSPGAVGLTLGITPSLGLLSHIILIMLMFVGRVGGLTLMYATISKGTVDVARRPVEKINVG